MCVGSFSKCFLDSSYSSVGFFGLVFADDARCERDGDPDAGYAVVLGALGSVALGAREPEEALVPKALDDAMGRGR